MVNCRDYYIENVRSHDQSEALIDVDYQCAVGCLMIVVVVAGGGHNWNWIFFGSGNHWAGRANEKVHNHNVRVRQNHTYTLQSETHFD